VIEKFIFLSSVNNSQFW